MTEVTADRLYDCKEGILRYIETLEGFNKLVSVRHEAYYDHGIRLDQFVVRGRWLLDTCGNLGKADKPREDYPLVLTRGEAELIASNPSKPDCTMYRMGETFLPPADVECPICHKFFTMDDCYESVMRHRREIRPIDCYVGMCLQEAIDIMNAVKDASIAIQCDIAMRNPRWEDNEPNPEYPRIKKNEGGWATGPNTTRKYMPQITMDHIIQHGDEASLNVWQYYHKDCNAKDYEDRTRAEFEKVFSDAGYGEVELRPIQNEYWQIEHSAPWFMVVTDVGAIKVGWRKRVINIELYGETKMAEWFADQDVTRGKDHIHAWGYDKCAEYLRRIREKKCQEKT